MACGRPQPGVERKRTAKALARFVVARPHKIDQRAEVIIGHFRKYSAHGIGGRGKGDAGWRLPIARCAVSFERDSLT